MKVNTTCSACGRLIGSQRISSFHFVDKPNHDQDPAIQYVVSMELRQGYLIVGRAGGPPAKDEGKLIFR